MEKTDILNISECRKSKPYSNREYFFRILWTIFSPFFFLSPRNLFFWRSWMLKIFGAKIGRNVHIYPSSKIYLPWNLSIGDNSCIGEWSLIYNLGHISIGNSVTISHKVHLCSGTHDYQDKLLPLIKKSISINNFSWICAESFIGPGCKVGEGAIVGARSVVVANVNPWEIVAGNPSRFIKKRIVKS